MSLMSCCCCVAVEDDDDWMWCSISLRGLPGCSTRLKLSISWIGVCVCVCGRLNAKFGFYCYYLWQYSH